MPDSSAPAPLPPPTAEHAPAAKRGGGFGRWMRRLTGWLSSIYVVGFLLAIVLLSWWGERHWLLSLLLFAPPYALLLPLLILTPLCLLLRPRLVLWHLLCAAIVCFGYMEFSWTRPEKRDGSVLKLVTYNAGQGDRRQFQSFIRSEEPDIILLQDVRHRGAEYSKAWPDRFVVGRGEFVAISRYPVESAEFVQQPLWDGQPVAARFQIQRENKTLIIYNVHLPTPRGQLRRFLSPKALNELFGDEEHGKPFANYREWVNARIELARKLASVFAAEKGNFIVCGDFNTPDHGYMHRMLSRGLIDAHARAGQGWGLTFPGGTTGTAAKLGPWLRIDFAYAGRGWEPVFCRTDPGRRSQHRALAAHFLPTP